MNEKPDNGELSVKQLSQLLKNPFPGYPASPVDEDIYNKYREEEDINPEDITLPKNLNEIDRNDPNDEVETKEDESGNDLDIPGSELDDKMEAIGSEDEENNYYSLGGDNHNNLDENRGE